MVCLVQVIVKYTDLANSSYHPEFDDLKRKLSTVNLNINSQPSNISAGIAEAIRNFDAIGSTNFLQVSFSYSFFHLFQSKSAPYV